MNSHYRPYVKLQNRQETFNKQVILTNKDIASKTLLSLTNSLVKVISSQD